MIKGILIVVDLVKFTVVHRILQVFNVEEGSNIVPIGIVIATRMTVIF